MNSASTYHDQWVHQSACPRELGTLVGIVLRLGEQQHLVVEEGHIDVDLGLDGDRWRHGVRHKDRQISLVSRRTLAALSADCSAWPRAGDNLIVDFDLSETNLPSGSDIAVGEVVLRVSSRIHLGCERFGRRFGEAARLWVNSPEYRRLRLRGVYCEVMQGGAVRRGDGVTRRTMGEG